MPVEEHDPFEDRFAAALRHAGGTFESHQLDLAARGETRGRRLRHRRAAIAGGVTGVALVGLGGTLVLPGVQADGGRRHSVAGSTSAPSTVAASSSRPSAVTGDDLVRTLKKLLPKGKFSNEEGRGTGDLLTPYARVVYDDGKGKSAVSVSVDHVRPGSSQARETTACPDKVFIPYDACTASTLADGSTLMVLQGYEYPDRRVDTKLWTAELVTPKGQHISVQEWNAAAEKDAPISRELPPLSPAQLKTLVTAPEWRAVADAIPVAPGTPTAEPSVSGAVPGGSASSTLASLLPKGVKVVSKGVADPGFGYVVLDDGKGASMVQVNVQADMSDVAGQLFGSGSRTLPDGTKVATHQGPGEKGGQGVVMWTVDTMRTDGRRVVISAFNSGTQHTAATRTAPALTLKQMEAIATSAKWWTHG
ncbi:hypothetical protein ABT173_03845 [Streptomyces sp. NPDC001795]|uniref:hypothetical protein n=1 Tax=unclassified Streptomyces TaxID=2593676 RepID=UPI00332BF896